jgi:hypothetical protein
MNVLSRQNVVREKNWRQQYCIRLAAVLNAGVPYHELDINFLNYHFEVKAPLPKNDCKIL